MNSQLTDKNIKNAVKLWFENKDDCIEIYGHISDWDTSNIINMSYLFAYKYISIFFFLTLLIELFSLCFKR